MYPIFSEMFAIFSAWEGACSRKSLPSFFKKNMLFSNIIVISLRPDFSENKASSGSNHTPSSSLFKEFLSTYGGFEIIISKSGKSHSFYQSWFKKIIWFTLFNFAFFFAINKAVIEISVA